MAITIGQTVSSISNRLAPVINAAGLDAYELEDYKDAITFALLDLGHTVVDVTNPTDAELTAVNSYNHYLDLVELRMLETLTNRLSLHVDTAIGVRRQSLGQIAERLGKMLDSKRATMEKKYGITSGVPLNLAYLAIEAQ